MSESSEKVAADKSSREQMRKTALGTIKISPYVAASSLLLFIATSFFTPLPFGLCITAIIIAAINSLLIWRNWYKPNIFVFVIAIILLTQGNRTAVESIPETSNKSTTALYLAFLSLYITAHFSLIFLLRGKIRSTVNPSELGNEP